MYKLIPFMELMKEVSFIFVIHLPKPEGFNKVFKNIQSCIVIVESNKILLRTKRMGIKYHHFWSFLQKRIFRICYIDIYSNKQETFSLSNLTNNHSSIYKENILDGNLKNRTFASTRASIIIQRTTITTDLT